MQLAKARERARILRRWLAAVALLAVLSIIGGILAWKKSEQRRQLLAEATAEEKLAQGDEPASFAHLARAIEYDPSSTLAGEKAFAALNTWLSTPPIAICRGHGAPVLDARFSPDGQRLVTASDDKTPRVWDAQSGKLLATLLGHEGAVRAASRLPFTVVPTPPGSVIESHRWS
jgi:hypothetical protein